MDAQNSRLRWESCSNARLFERSFSLFEQDKLFLNYPREFDLSWERESINYYARETIKISYLIYQEFVACINFLSRYIFKSPDWQDTFVRSSTRVLRVAFAGRPSFFRPGFILVYISRLHPPVGRVHVVTVSRVPRRKRAVTAKPVVPEDRSSVRGSTFFSIGGEINARSKSVLPCILLTNISINCCIAMVVSDRSLCSHTGRRKFDCYDKTVYYVSLVIMLFFNIKELRKPQISENWLTHDCLDPLCGYFKK